MFQPHSELAQKIRQSVSHIAFLSILGIILVCANKSTNAQEDKTIAQRYKQVFVPVDQMEEVLKKHPQGVLLSKEEFEKFYKDAQDAAAKASTSLEKDSIPKGLLVNQAIYDVKVDAKRLQVKIQCQILKPQSGWAIMSIPTEGLFLESALIGDKNAAVTQYGKNRDQAGFVTDQTGDMELTLTLSAPLSSVGSDLVSTFSIINAPAVSLQIEKPKDKFLVLNGTSLDVEDDKDAVTKYTIPVGGLPQVVIRMTDQKSDAKSETLVFSSTQYGVFVRPGELTWQAKNKLQIFGRGIDSVRFSVPVELEIADVQSVGLESWNLEEDPDDDELTQITLKYRQSFSDNKTITLKGVMSTATDESWMFPVLNVRGAASQTGRALIQVPPGIRLQQEDSDGARPAVNPAPVVTSNANNPSNTPQNNQFVFDFWKPDAQISFSTQEKQRQLQAAMTNVLLLNEDAPQIKTIVDVETFFAPLFQFHLELPAEWTITSLTKDGKEAQWQLVPAEAGINLIEVNLEKPLKPGRKIQLLLNARQETEEWPIEEETVNFTLPKVLLPDVDVLEGSYGIIAGDGLVIVPVDMMGLDPSKLGLQNEKLGYVYQSTEFEGSIDLKRKPSRVSVQSTLMNRLDRKTISTFIESLVEIQGGGIRELELLLDENTGTGIRFQLLNPNVQITEQIPGEVTDGKRSWKLRFDQRVTGSIVIVTQLAIPRAEDSKSEKTKAKESEEKKEISFPKISYPSAEQEAGFIAVEADAEQQLTLIAQNSAGQSLAEVDPADFPTVQYQPKERIVAAYRYVRPGYSLNVKETRFDQHPVPTAIIESAVLQTLLDDTSEQQNKATLQFKAIGVQSLRLRLPENSKLLSLLIDKAPIEIRKDPQGYLIPLSMPDNSKPQTITLDIFYQTISERSENAKTQKFESHSPQLSVISGSGIEQQLSILEQQWELIYPRQLALVASTGAFAPISDLDSIGFLKQIRTGIDFGSMSELLFRVIAFVILFCCVLAIIKLITAKRYGILIVLILVILVTPFFLLPSVQRANETANWKTANPDKMEMPMVNGVPIEGLKKESKSLSEKAKGIRRRLGAEGDESKKEVERIKAILREQIKKNELAELKNAPTDSHLQQLNDVEMSAVNPVASDSIAYSKSWANYQNLSTKYGARKSGGLLSLAMNLEHPSGSKSKTFQHLGTSSAGDTTTLAIQYHHRDSMRHVRWLAIAITVIIFWFIRKSTLRTKLAFTLLGIMIPLGLGAIIPAFAGVIVEGIFIGTLAGLCLWAIVLFRDCLLACCNAYSRNRQAIANQTAPTAILILISLSLLFASTNTASAQKGMRLKKSNNRFSSKPTLNSKYAPKINTKKPAPKPTLNSKFVPGINTKTTTPEPVTETPTIYLPYDVKSGPDTAKKVFLTRKEFLRLYSLTNPKESAGTNSPVDSVLGETLLVGKLISTEADENLSRVEIQSRVTITTFKDEPTSVRLPFHHVAILEAKLNDESATLNSNAKTQTYEIVISKAGLHVLDVKFAIAVKTTGSAGELKIPLTPEAYGKFSFELPEKDLRVRVNNSINAYRINEEGGQSILESPLPKTGTLKVTWEPKQKNGSEMTFVQADTRSSLMILDPGIEIISRISTQVRQGAINDFQIALSPDVQIQSITGEDVGGWQMEVTPDEKKLTLFFRRSLDSAQKDPSTYITLRLFVPLSVDEGDSEAFAVPNIVPQNVTRNSGRIGVFASSSLQVRTTKSEALRQINANRFEKSLEKARTILPQLAYEFSKHPNQLELEITRNQPEAKAIAYHGVSINARKTEIASLMEYDLTGTPQSRLKLYMPEGYLPLKVESPGLSDWYIFDEEEIILEFQQPVSGRVFVSLKGSTPLDLEEPDMLIDVPLPLDIETLESHIGVWFGKSQSGRMSEFETWKSVDPARLPTQIRKLQPKLPQFGFRSSEVEPDLITIDLSRKKAQLQGDSVTLIAVTETSVDYGFSLKWKINQAAESQFIVTTPDWLEGRVEFTHPNIRQVLEKTLDDGRVQWTIELHSPVSEEFFLTAAASISLPADNKIVAPKVEFQTQNKEKELTSLATQRHYAVLVNLSQAQLTSENVELVSRNQLPFKLMEALLVQAAEIVKLKNDEDSPAPVWTRQRFERQHSSGATVRVADLVTVLQNDGSWRTEAKYTVRNFSKQFLALQIPEQSRILSVFVKEKPSRAVQATVEDKATYLIALPKTSAADLSFVVQVVLEGKSEKSLVTDLSPVPSEWQIPTPNVVSLKQSKLYGIPVAKTLLSVYVPEGIEASEVVSTQKTNMSPGGGGEVYQEELVRELKSLNRILKDKKNYSFSQKRRAVDNLKLLKKRTNNWSGQGGQQGGQQAGWIAKPEGQLLKELEDNSRQIEQSEEIKSQIQNSNNGREFIFGNNAGINKLNTPTRNSKKSNEKMLGDTFDFGLQYKVPESGKKSIQKFSKGQRMDTQNSNSDRGRLRDNIINQNTIINENLMIELQTQGLKNDFYMKDKSETESRFSINENKNFSDMNTDGKPGQGGVRFNKRSFSRSGGMGGTGGQVPAMKPAKPIIRNSDDKTPLYSYFEGMNRSTITLNAPQNKLPGDDTIAQWTATGGLSLPMTIPQNGNKLVFSKVGGNPKLTLKVHSEESLQSVFRFGWTIAWVLGAFLLAIVCLNKNNTDQANRPLLVSIILMILGAVIFLLTPIGLNLLGLIFIVCGIIVWKFPSRFESAIG